MHFRLADLALDLTSLEHIPGGVQAIFRATKDGVPFGFGADGRHEYERVRFFGRQPEDYVADLFRTLDIVGKPGADIILGSVANTTTVARPLAGSGTAPMDGWVQRLVSSETFATIRAGAGTQVNTGDPGEGITAWIQASTTTDEYTRLRRAIAGFDTSPVDTDTISSATVQLYGTSGSVFQAALGGGLCIVSASPASESTLAASDFAIGNFGTTELATRIATGSWTEGGYNTFTLNASGLAHINKTGNTLFGFMVSFDFDNSAPTWSSGASTKIPADAADQTGTSQDPVITIEHSSGAVATHPAGINRGLLNNGLISSGLIR